MIVSAHLIPHSPLLLSTIGKERTEALSITRAAIEQCVAEIRAAKPDTIIIVSNHGTVYKDAFSTNLHDPYTAHFEEFGDFATRFTAKPDLMIADRLKRHWRIAGVPHTQSSDDSLDYGSAVSLSFLTPLLLNTRIIPLSPSLLDGKAHFEAGLHASEVLLASNKRFSIICSGDLSQRLSTISPAGFSKNGEIFDTKIKELLTAHNILGLLKLDQEMIADAGECAYRPLLLVLGMIEAFRYQTEIKSYEAPFGVGELVANFKLG
jgi:aromatic ring-opening dioxygenase LigB subunit